MMLASSNSVNHAMVGTTRVQRFKLSLPFLNRKKKKGILLDDAVEPSSGHDGTIDLPDTGLGDILQDITEESEEQLEENDNENHHVVDSADEYGLENGHHCEENLTLALVPKSVSPHDLYDDLSLIKAPMSYHTYDPNVSPPSRRKTDRSSSTKAFDSSTRSGSLRTESLTMSRVQSSSPRGKGWMGSKCGFGSCSKHIDMEREVRPRGKGDIAGLRRQHSLTKLKDVALSWERENEWSVLAQVESDVARKKVGLRKKKSSKLAPSPGTSPGQRLRVVTPEIKCLLRDPYEEMREAARYDLPSQRSDHHLRSAEVGSNVETEIDLEGNNGEERLHPWERSFSLPSSDDELFTTSFEIDALSNTTRRKKWSSNSSDETEARHRRRAGYHIRSKSTWSTQSLRSLVFSDKEDLGDLKTREKKGSRIIFLSTPPRSKDFDNDAVEPQTDHSTLKSSSDRFSEYCKLDPAGKEPRFERASSVGGYKTSLEVDLEANAKAWTQLDVRATKRDDSFDRVREVPMMSASEFARHIDVQVEDQLVNLRLESDLSDSSQGEDYNSSRESKKYSKGLLSKSFLDQQEKQSLAPKKKRGHSRRRKGRKNRAPPPPLPSDLHGKVRESVAVVKSSYDPYTDFRDSMVEMIVEKEIQGAADLEELLRCYLSLNSPEYHSVIVKVFADVWRELFADAI